MRYLRTMKLVLAVVFLSAACTRTNPASTCASGSCSDPAFPYCDSSGAIGGTPDECISVQCTPGTVGACKDSTAYTCDSTGTSYTTTECMSGCDPTTGCKHAGEPSAAISCGNNEYVACNADGTGMISETCVLGCSSDAVACQTFVPSNGLGPALIDAASRSAMTIPAGARIDTDTGVIQDTNGTTIPSYSVVVQQNGASAIRVFEGSSFEIHSVSISGNNAVAFVAPGLVDIAGLVQARAIGSTTGPGSQKVPAACAALDSTQYSAGCGPGATGAGGGGNATVGGIGGGTLGTTGFQGAPGTPSSGFVPLEGGCTGGTQHDLASAIFARGGGGGGALQIVSGTKIDIHGAGVIDLGGGGGEKTAGGGSGGTLVLEAPAVSITGPAGFTTNGGAGGGCNQPGASAGTTLDPAVAPTCSYFFVVNGGTINSPPGNACVPNGTSCASGACAPLFGGGGGAAGRARIATALGGYVNQAAVISAVVKIDAQTIH